MKLAARISGLDALHEIRRSEAALAAAALDAAAGVLARELEEARERAGLAGALTRSRRFRRRVVAAPDAASVARELGTPFEPPAPWLAPVLPAARATMRAAAVQAVARALSRK